MTIPTVRPSIPSPAPVVRQPDDPLSELLDGLRFHCDSVDAFDSSEPASHTHGGCIVLYAVTAGKYRLRVDGRDDITELNAGDLLLLTRPSAHRIDSGHEAASTMIDAVANPTPARIVRVSLNTDEGKNDAIYSALPPVVHLTGGVSNVGGCLNSLVSTLAREAKSQQPGSSALVNRLAGALVIQTIREFVAQSSTTDGDLMTGLLSAPIGKAVGLIRQQLDAPWTLSSLARKVGMSRSVFAARFVRVVGQTPSRYILDCRMRRACELLVEDRFGLKEIAARSGYASEAAFSNAFKRWAGVAPGRYRRRHTI